MKLTFQKLKNFYDKNKAFVIILLIFLITTKLLTYNYTEFRTNMSVGVGHAYTAKSLALHQTFNVNNYWGNAGVDVFKIEENYYTAYALLNPIYMSIFYFLFQVFAYLYTKVIGNMNGDLSIIFESLSLTIPNSISTIILSITYFKLTNLLNFERKKQILGLLALLFGTIIFSYNVTFFSHIHSAAFILLAYYLLIKNRYFLMGIIIGLAFLNEYPTILFSVAFFIYQSKLFFTKEISLKLFLNNLIRFAIPVSVFVLLQLTFNYYMWGSFHKFSESVLYEYRLANTDKPSGVFSNNVFWGLIGLYLSPIKGLILISPFLIYSIKGLRKQLKLTPHIQIALIYITLISILYAMWSDCYGGTSLGPRYLISIIPLLTIISLQGINSKRDYFIYIFLLLYSFIIIFINIIDKLATGTFNRCVFSEYVMLNKALGYIQSSFKNSIADLKIGPIIIKYLLKGNT